MSSTETSEAGYAGSYLQRFQNYLKVSGEQVAVCSCVTKALPEESKRYAQICFSLELFLASSSASTDQIAAFHVHSIWKEDKILYNNINT